MGGHRAFLSGVCNGAIDCASDLVGIPFIGTYRQYFYFMGCTWIFLNVLVREDSGKRLLLFCFRSSFYRYGVEIHR